MKKILEGKNNEFLILKTQVSEKTGTDAIFYEYLYIEKLKYFLYEIIECNFILRPEKMSNIISLTDEINNTILRDVISLDTMFKETSKNISKNSKNYLRYYEKEYKRIYKEDYFKIKIEDLEKLNNKKFIEKLEKYLYIFLAKIDVKNTIKDYLAINFIIMAKNQ